MESAIASVARGLNEAVACLNFVYLNCRIFMVNLR
jgi:hypothetical protein